jgi:hypothetical protein
MAWKTGVRLQERTWMFLFNTASRPIVAPTLSPMQWMLGTPSAWVKRLKHEADYSPPSSTKSNKALCFTSITQHAFISWCLNTGKALPVSLMGVSSLRIFAELVCSWEKESKLAVALICTCLETTDVKSEVGISPFGGSRVETAVCSSARISHGAGPGSWDKPRGPYTSSTIYYKPNIIPMEPRQLSRYSDALRAGRPGFDSRQGRETFLCFTASRLAPGPTHPPSQWVPGDLSPGAKRPGLTFI